MEAGINAGIHAGQKSGIQLKSGLNIKLPKRLIEHDESVILDMNSTAGWTTVAGTLALNTTQYKSGTSSLKLTSNVGATCTLKTTGQWDFSSDSGRSIRFWVYAHSVAETTFTNITIRACSTLDETNVFKCVYYPSEIGMVQNKWNLILGGQWTVLAGTPSWADIKVIKFYVTTVAGQTSEISFDMLTHGLVRKPAILLMNDDGYASDYTTYQMLRARNMVSTSYIVSSLIGTTNKLTNAQLQEMYAYGIDIGNHTATHPLYSGVLTVQQYIDEMEACRSYLDALGLTRSSKHVGATGNAYSSDWVTAAEQWGALTLRPGSMKFNVYGDDFPYSINTWASANPVLSEMIAYAQNAIDDQWTPIVTLHQMAEQKLQLADITTSDYATFLNHAKEQGWQSLTIDEYYRLNTSSITVHHK